MQPATASFVASAENGNRLYQGGVRASGNGGAQATASAIEMTINASPIKAQTKPVPSQVKAR